MRLQPDFPISQVKTVCKDSDSLRHFRPIIWNLIPHEIKDSDSIDGFLHKIRKWNTNIVPVKYEKNFITSGGFVETTL